MTETAEKVFEFIQQYKGMHKAIPAIDFLCTELKLKDYQGIQAIKELLNEGLLIQKAKPPVEIPTEKQETIPIEKKKPNLKKVAEVNISPEILGKIDAPKTEPIKEAKIVEKVEPKPEQKEKKVLNKLFIPKPILRIFRIFVLVVGILTICTSIYFNWVWYNDIYNAFIGAILSIIFVCSATAAFEAMIIFASQGRWGLSVVSGIIWVIVTLVTMSSTLAGQYNNMIRKLNVANKEQENNVSTKNAYDLLDKTVKSLNIDIDSKREDIERLKKAIAKAEEGSKAYLNLNWAIRDNGAQIAKIQAQILPLTEQMGNLLKSGKGQNTEKKDYYSWLGRITKIDDKSLQFWQNLLYTVFLDLISPISFAIAMFIREEEEV